VVDDQRKQVHGEGEGIPLFKPLDRFDGTGFPQYKVERLLRRDGNNGNEPLDTLYTSQHTGNNVF
jgi:hypothetical protein